LAVYNKSFQTKNSINRLLVKLKKFGTVDILAESVTEVCNFHHFRWCNFGRIL